MIRLFPARFSALSSGPLKELTSIRPPASNGARALGKCGFRMTKTAPSCLAAPLSLETSRDAMTQGERGLSKASQSIMSRRCARFRHHFVFSRGSASFF